MFICNNCGEVFEYPKIDKQLYSDPYGEEDYPVCPECFDNDYEEAVQCECCGKYFNEANMHSGWCVDCLFEKLSAMDAHDFVRLMDYYNMTLNDVADYLNYIERED